MKLSSFLLPGLATSFVASPSGIQRSASKVNRLAAIEPSEATQNLPRVGKEFEHLTEAQAKQALTALLDLSGPFYERVAKRMEKGFDFDNARILVGSKEDFTAGENTNCYLFATNQQRNAETGKYYPGHCVPPLTSAKHSDNCDILKDHIFSEFGSQVREASGSGDCAEHEIPFTSFASDCPVDGDRHDFHFTREVGGETWHKPGKIPLEPVDISSGRLAKKSTLYIQTAHRFINDIDGHDVALGFIEGIGLVKDVSLSVGVDYTECHAFCLDPNASP